MGDRRRATPSVGKVLADPAIARRCHLLGPAFVKAVVSDVVDRCRRGELSVDEVAAAVLGELPDAPSHLRPVLNATGIIVHTNLGRAPLSAPAQRALLAAAGTTDVEFDLASGRRGARGSHAIAALVRAVPHATAAMVVNNGAAALMLIARVLADRRNIVVSRGEMVEIGDGFRIPDLLAASGAEIREVGTTNRTHLADYLRAIDENTAFVAKIHPSNFAIEGFTSAVPLREISAAVDCPVVADVGSGLLTPHRRLPAEPDVDTALADGAALVVASGDKLLGGPQCGLLFGDTATIEILRRHPLARAVRVDKLTLAALEASVAGPDTPIARALTATSEELMARARALLRRVTASHPGATVVASKSAVGGGGAPAQHFDSAAIALPGDYSATLRRGPRPVVARLSRGSTVIDLAAIDPADDDALADAIIQVARASGSCTP